jgi:hypothetical protein
MLQQGPPTNCQIIALVFEGQRLENALDKQEPCKCFGKYECNNVPCFSIRQSQDASTCATIVRFFI